MAAAVMSKSYPLHAGNEALFKENYQTSKMLYDKDMVKIYEGIRLYNNSRVIIKITAARYADMWDNTNKIRTPMEVSTLHKLMGKPGIIQLSGYFTSNNWIIVVTEAAGNTMDLKQFIRKVGKINENVARKIFAQIVEAVIQVYEAGILHTALETVNILIDVSDLKILLKDFDFARIIPESDIISRNPGFPQPPDEMIGKLYYREHFIVGKVVQILYHMLTGKTGFKKPFYYGISMNKLIAEPGISEECKEFIFEGLFADEEERPMLQELLCHPWISQKNI